MRLSPNQMVGLAVAAVALALAAYLTFLAGGRNGLVLVDGQIEDERRESGEASAADPRSLRTLYRTLDRVQKYYLDPSRIDPKAMLVAGLRAVQENVAKVLVREEGRFVTVRLGAEERRFDLSDVTTPWLMLQRFKEISAFLHAGLTDDDADFKSLEYAVVNGMLQTLDPHSQLLPPDVYRDMRDKTQGKFGGLGIVISIRDGQLTVVSPIDGTPAALAGLKAFDQIVKIGEASTVNMPLDDAVDMLRGEPGTMVSIHVLRKGWEEPRRFDIVRAIIEVKSVESHMLPGQVGYARIKDFQGNTADELKRQLAALESRGIRGLVLDLRNDPGGLLEAAIRVCDIFMKGGVIVTTAGQGPAERDVRRAEDDRDEPGYPLVVLINAGSASASEIVAGALKNSGRALLVGQRTFGKGTVQVLYDFQDGSALKLTTAQYLTPGDVSIQSVGVVPHVDLVPLRADDEMLDLVVESEWREKDLDRHLEDRGGAGSEDQPASSLRYLWTAPPGAKTAAGDGDAGPDDIPAADRPFEPDFEIEFARDLVLRLGRTAEATMGLAVAGQLVAERQAREEQRLAAVLARKGIDWSVGSDDRLAEVLIDVRPKDGGPFAAGRGHALIVTVENRGPGTLYRLLASTRSDFRPLDDKEIAFGRVEPGETVERELQFKVPRDTFSRVDDVKLVFGEARGRSVPDAVLRFAVSEAPKPSFAWALVLDDTETGNGDGRLQKGEAVRIRGEIENRGPGDAVATFATLKNLSGSQVFITRGRESLGKLPRGERRPFVFAFEAKPGLEDDKARFELAVMDVDLRVYNTEKIVFPIEAASGAARSGTGTPPRWTTLSGPPVLTLEPIAPVTREPAVRLRGRAMDESRVRDVYVFVGRDKVFFKPAAPDARSLEFEATLPLEIGQNVITVVAEETADLDTRAFLAVRRDREDGMPFVAVRTPAGGSEPLGATPGP